MIKIITYGTFDTFHYGHLEILRRAKEFGDYLIVGVSSDDFNRKKNKNCLYSDKHRMAIVNSIKYVDMVIPELNWEQKENDIIKNNVNILIMGNDWKGKFDHLNNICDVKYLSRTKGISSTRIKKNIKKIEY